MTDFRVGDLVKVVNSYDCYTTYGNYSGRVWEDDWKSGRSPQMGTSALITRMGVHDRPSSQKVITIEDNQGQIFFMDPKGIEHIKEEKETSTFPCCFDASIFIRRSASRWDMLTLESSRSGASQAFTFFKTIIACPFCGTTLPTPCGGSDLEDYQSMEDDIMDCVEEGEKSTKVASADEYCRLANFIMEDN